MAQIANPLASLSRTRQQARRAGEVVRVFSRYGFGAYVKTDAPRWLQRWFTEPDGRLLAEYTIGERLRMALTELGTTYIKLGQMLSTREDIVGVQIAAELSKLQADTPADPPEYVRERIEHEFGAPVEDLYAEFDFVPLGSASIGQVHAAELPGGVPVVVKVQHDGIEAVVLTDLQIMQQVAELADRYAPSLPYDVRAIVDEFRRQLLRELDLRQEARNLERFIENFAGNPAVKFPAPTNALSSKYVLTMERLDGFKLADQEWLDAEGVDRKELARNGANVFLEMIFRDGFFHADPHPGNFLVLSDHGLAEHRIGLLDCGMVGRIDERTREALEDLLLSFVTKDVDGIVDVILRICAVPRTFDRRAFTADVDLFIADYLSGSLAEIDLSGMLQELIAIIHTYHIVAPANIVMLGKTLALLEGTGRLLDPDFDLWELAQPYYRQILERKYAPDKLMRTATRAYRDWRRLLTSFPREVADLLHDIGQGELQVRLHVGGLDNVVNRIVYGLVATAIILASALLWSANVPPRVFDISVIGALGMVFGLLLVARLLYAIYRSGGL